jgi:hypothetical protein
MDLYSAAGVYQLSIQIVSASQSAETITAFLLASGAAVAPATDMLAYWEGNKDQECVGLSKICPATPGTLYGISQSQFEDFKGGYIDLGGDAMSYDVLNFMVQDTEDRSGVSPNMGITSAKGMTVLKNLSEDLKRYNMEVKSWDGKAGFKGIEIISDKGSFGIISSQMCPDDELYIGNRDYLQLVMRSDFGWFEDDGTVLLRDQNKDQYNARYGGYFEAFCSKPNAFYRVTGFALPDFNFGS